MISAYVGTPGSGKSYEAMVKILANLKLGRVVFTNIDGLDNEKSREHIKIKTGLDDFQLSHQLRHLTEKQMINFPEIVAAVPGSIIIVDEVHKLFSNRNWQAEENKKFCEWASTHRHGGYDVLLITQDIEKVDKHARSLIEWCHFYKKINHFGGMVKGKYRKHVYDSDNHSGKPLASSTHTYDKTVFPCYSSYDSSTVKELGIEKHMNILNHPIFYVLGVVVLIFGYTFSQSSFIHGEILPGMNKAKHQAEASKKGTSPGENKMTPGENGNETADTEEKEIKKILVLHYLSNGVTHVTVEGSPVKLPKGVVIKKTAYL